MTVPGPPAAHRENPVRSLGEILGPYCVFVVLGALIHVAISYGPIYLYHLTLILLMARFCAVLTSEDRIAVASPHGALEWTALFFVGVYAASWTWARDWLHAGPYVVYMLVGGLTAVASAVISSDSAGLRRLGRLAAIVVGIEVVVSLLEIATPFRMPVSPFSSYASWFGREDKLVAMSVTEELLRYALQSPTGFHWNPNNLAILMVIALGFFLNARRHHWRWLGVASAVIIIVFTASRASLLGAVLVFLVYYLMLSVRRAAVMLACVLPIAVAGLLLTGAAEGRLSARGGQVLDALEAVQILFSKGDVRTDSIGIRQQLMANGFEAVAESGGIGVGPGGSVLVQRDAGGKAAEIGSMHNFWLEILVDCGFLGLLAFTTWYVLAWLACFQISVYTHDQYHRYVAASLTCALAGFSVAMVSASSVLYFPPMWVMFGAVLGLRRAENGRSTRELARIRPEAALRSPPVATVHR